MWGVCGKLPGKMKVGSGKTGEIGVNGKRGVNGKNRGSNVKNSDTNVKNSVSFVEINIIYTVHGTKRESGGVGVAIYG